jgi:hypothetical protein
MAESRYKVRAIGAPFSIEYSSCSDYKPKIFDWSLNSGEVFVSIDRGLFYQPDLNYTKEKRFGWICESKYIIPDVYNFLITNYKVLFNNYYDKIFTCDLDLIRLDSRFVFTSPGSSYPWIRKDEWAMYNKKKLCSMFCSPKMITPGHKYRHTIAKQITEYKIDLFGGAYGSKRTIIDPQNPWKTKIDGMADYMFSIVIENGKYDNYWTEKLTDCFATGTIPIYWGTKNIPEIFDKDGIIWLEEGKEKETINSLSEDLFLRKKKAIQHNFSAIANLKITDDELGEKIL